MELLLKHDIDKQTNITQTTLTNTLKAKIQLHSVPISEGSDPPEGAEPYIIENAGPDQPELHPYVSCVLFFEEYNEKDYEEQIEQLHHIFQQANVPEGLIATYSKRDPSISSATPETDKNDEMVLQCIKNDTSRVPVLALWCKEGLPTAVRADNDGLFESLPRQAFVVVNESNEEDVCDVCVLCETPLRYVDMRS
eukprot:COSAG02_NODE_6547_length_3502_cov_58.042766_4_plen_195_part_00